ncbi:MAG: amidohydrolase, partial [Eudoraea sp.]|nr:amidohydrolase [Eudoraea sp.]
MVIDSHQHFWQYNPKKHTWIDESMKVIRRDFTPLDLKEVFATNGIDGCVAVQADQTLKETDFLLTLANENNFIKGVVGWVDLKDKNVDNTLEAYSQHKKIKGWRH